MRLAAAFLQAVGPTAAPLGDALAELDWVLAGHVAAGRSAWPDVVVLTPEDFAGRLAKVVHVSDNPAEALKTIAATDFYLACACGAGEQNAIRTFETRFINPTISQLCGRGSGGDSEAELRQLLLMRLFVSEPGSPARIFGYRGQGPLLGWLRTIASRAAIDLQRHQQPVARAASMDFGDVRSHGPDPELEYLECLYRAELGGALVATLAALSERDKNFLRLHYLDDMAMETIASLFRVSRRTVHRAITRSRSEVLQQTHALLAERLKISRSEFETIMGLAGSQLDLNLHELLAAQQEKIIMSPAESVSLRVNDIRL